MIAAFIIAALMVQGGDYAFCRGAAGDSLRVSLTGMNSPSRVAVAPSGAVFVLDAATNELRKYAPDGSLVSHAGGFGTGNDGFDHPADVNAVSDLQILVADYGNNRVVIFDARLNRTESVEADITGTGERIFGHPRSVAADRYGAMYILDGDNTRIVKVNSSRDVERFIGGADAGKGRLSQPSRVRVGDNDRVYVTDGARVVTFDVYGNFIQVVTLADSSGTLTAVVAGTGFAAVADTLRGLDADLSIPLAGSGPDGAIRDVSSADGWIAVLRDSTVIKIRLPDVGGEK